MQSYLYNELLPRLYQIVRCIDAKVVEQTKANELLLTLHQRGQAAATTQTKNTASARAASKPSVQIRFYNTNIIRLTCHSGGKKVTTHSPSYPMLAPQFKKNKALPLAIATPPPAAQSVASSQSSTYHVHAHPPPASTDPYFYSLAINVNPFTFSIKKILKSDKKPSLYKNVKEKAVLSTATDGHFTKEHRLPLLDYVEGRWLFSLDLAPDDELYGLGEKYGKLNKRGELIISKNHDALGVNAEISYKNIPFLWSNNGWGVFVHTPATVEHALGFAPLSHRSYVGAVEDNILDLFFILGADGEEILAGMQEILGGVPALPDWSFGVWMSRAYYKDAVECLDVAKEIRQRKIPCDVFNLDGRTWLDRKTRFGFQWDKTRYPNPKAFTQKLKALNYKICVWEYPLISIDNERFKAVADKGWLLKNAQGETYIYEWDLSPFGEVLEPLPKSGIIDFTHPDAYAWYGAEHQALFAAGIDIIKSDFGEQVPDDAVAFNGASGRSLHNVYPLLYNKCVYEATQRYRKGVPMVWGRSAWSGSHRYPMYWGGDPQSDWGGLSASIRGGLCWGMSGGTYYTSDIGGFYGADFSKVSDDLYVRWSQAAVYSTHTRFHGIGRREPWFYGKEAQRMVTELLYERMHLLPYFILSATLATTSALPLMRAMPLAFPHDKAATTYDHQYMLGYAYLCDPIIHSHSLHTTYLPSGSNWLAAHSVDYASSASPEPNSPNLRGASEYQRSYTLAETPLFLAEGSIIPRLSSETNLEWVGETLTAPISELRFYGSPFFSADSQATSPAFTSFKGTPFRKKFIAERKKFLLALRQRWKLTIMLDTQNHKVSIYHPDESFLKKLTIRVLAAKHSQPTLKGGSWELYF